MIKTIQNSERQIQRLGAQRQLYTNAKSIFWAMAILSGPIAVIAALVGMAFQEYKVYFAIWGVILTLCDLVWLSPLQKRFRESAARIQEAFDCDVLEIPWNDLKVGKIPDPELVKEQFEKYSKWAHKMPPLTDWYSPKASDAPISLGRIACQRSNCWWDSKLRRRYALLVILGVGVVSLIVCAIALLQKSTLDEFIIRAVVPLSPTLVFGIRQYREHLETAIRLDSLKDHLERLWREALAGSAESTLASKSRIIQDEIFENRRRNPLIPDFVYSRLQSKYEEQMGYGVSELIGQAVDRMPFR